jgi:hypothetical protein
MINKIFLFFQDDFYRSNKTEETGFGLLSNLFVNLNRKNCQNLNQLTEYKESLLKNSYSDYLIQDLIFLYQKLIEEYSSTGDELNLNLILTKLKYILKKKAAKEDDFSFSDNDKGTSSPTKMEIEVTSKKQTKIKGSFIEKFIFE